MPHSAAWRTETMARFSSRTAASLAGSLGSVAPSFNGVLTFVARPVELGNAESPMM